MITNNSESINTQSCQTAVIASTDLNRVHHANFLDNTLPDKCANLIIADPPYFEVKGEFDFIWKSFNDYLIDVEKWALECKRVLADNGTLLWWGDKKKIAYSQIIIDKYFNLENSLIWRKKDSMQYQYYSPDMARSFNTHNERLLMYSKNIENEFQNLRGYFEELQKWLNIPKSKIVEEIGQSSDHCFRWGSSQWDLPINDTYDKIIKVYNIDKWEKFKPYNELKEDFENQRRFFYNPNKFEEVLEFSQESHITRKYDHETKKPETLTRALVLTCSRPNDLIVVPFAGSGTECAMSVKENRTFIAYEITKKHVNTSNERVKTILDNPQLFAGL